MKHSLMRVDSKILLAMKSLKDMKKVHFRGCRSGLLIHLDSSCDAIMKIKFDSEMVTENPSYNFFVNLNSERTIQENNSPFSRSTT
jgi:hypothetical protein